AGRSSRSRRPGAAAALCRPASTCFACRTGRRHGSAPLGEPSPAIGSAGSAVASAGPAVGLTGPAVGGVRPARLRRRAAARRAVMRRVGGGGHGRRAVMRGAGGGAGRRVGRGASGPTARRVRRRVAVTGFVTAACFLTLLTRLVHLQVAERPAYAARAEANRWREVLVEAPRGRILDRAGRVLGDSGSAWRIRLDRRIPAGRRAALLDRLAPVLGVSASELRASV